MYLERLLIFIEVFEVDKICFEFVLKVLIEDPNSKKKSVLFILILGNPNLYLFFCFVFVFTSANIERVACALKQYDIAVHNQNLIVLGCRINIVGSVTSPEFEVLLGCDFSFVCASLC